MYFCYRVAENYGLAIILFTLVSKVILFPVSMIVQKNSVRMVRMKPELDDLKLRNVGDKDKIAEEQIELYNREKYSPAMGCLPSLIQIPLILGLINIIYNPLQHQKQKLTREEKAALRIQKKETISAKGRTASGFTP